jgi:hypothetical protein
VRRAAVVAFAVASSLIAVSPAYGASAAAVPDRSQVELVGGQRVTFGAHGDRVPRGSDVRMRRLMKRAPRFAAKLPVIWCGTPRSTDDSVHNSFSGPRFKVVYAYANDQPDRFSDYRDMIQGDVATVRDWVIAASGNAKSIRFDTGTDCGPEFVDIAVIQLPWSRSFYRGSALRAEYVHDHVDQALGGLGGKWNTLIYADALYANDGVTGSGLLTSDDTHGAANESNVGGAAAMIWGHGGPDFSYERQTTFLHEATHNMGAVQDSAPNSTLGGHCYEMWDVMCYDDDGPGPVGLVFNCLETFPLPYECGGDDYFNPSPVAGTYLATHWNVYDSAFLCPVATCVASGGSQPPPPPPPPNPVTPGPGDTTPADPGPAPDPGQPVGADAEAWLTTFLADSTARVKKVGLRGLAQGKAVPLRGTVPAGYAVQVDLLWGASAIAGGSLDASGVARLKVPRIHRLLLARKRKVRLVLQAVIRSAAAGGIPSLKRVAVTLKAPPRKKKHR